jgi:mono/diheme cytochrome c family protein
MKWALVALIVGCDRSSGGSASALDVGAAAGPCDDVPVVTWETHGRALMIENCQPCHASTAIDRVGAPEGVIFDSESDALSLSDSILRVIDVEDPTMPPSRNLSELDRQLIEIWLTCWP